MIEIDASVLSVPFALSADAQACQAKLSDDIANINREAADLREHVDKVKSVSDAEWSTDHETSIDRLRGKRIGLLGRALAIRQHISAYYSTLKTERSDAINTAHAALEKVRASVRASLVSIGYGESIQQAMIERHADVWNARNEHDSLTNFNLQPTIYVNDAAAAKLQAELAKIKNQAVGVLG